MVALSKAGPLVERFGVHNLPLGGENGYKGVRKCRKGFQGYTPKKRHTTAEKQTAQEAAIALAQLKYDLEHGLYEEPTRRARNSSRRSIFSGASHSPPPTLHALLTECLALQIRRRSGRQ